MEIKPIDPNMIPSKAIDSGKKNLMAFMDSDAEAVELIDWQSKYSTWRSAYTVHRNAVKALDVNVQIVKRGDRMFLVKKEK